MCEFVGIIVYQGLVEEVQVFNKREEAVEWIAGKTNEYGIENTIDSLLWDVKEQSRIDLGFAVSHQEKP
jgi:hypothetical protein